MVCTEENLETKSRKNEYASAFSRVNTAVKKSFMEIKPEPTVPNMPGNCRPGR